MAKSSNTQEAPAQTPEVVRGKNIYERILQVSSEIMIIEKNMTVGTGNSSYKAVADRDVVLAVKAAEAKYGILSIPVRQELIEHQVYNFVDSRGNSKTSYVDIVKMTVELVNVDNPSEKLTVESYGRGIDPGDKGFGKASTYARKYCLLNVYKIATGDDPDKEASNEGTYTPPQQTTLQATPVQAAPQRAMETKQAQPQQQSAPQNKLARLTWQMLEEKKLDKYIAWMAKFDPDGDKELYAQMKHQFQIAYDWENLNLFDKCVDLAARKNFVDDLHGMEEK